MLPPIVFDECQRGFDYFNDNKPIEALGCYTKAITHLVPSGTLDSKLDREVTLYAAQLSYNCGLVILHMEHGNGPSISLEYALRDANRACGLFAQVAVDEENRTEEYQLALQLKMTILCGMKQWRDALGVFRMLAQGNVQAEVEKPEIQRLPPLNQVLLRGLMQLAEIVKVKPALQLYLYNVCLRFVSKDAALADEFELDIYVNLLKANPSAKTVHEGMKTLSSKKRISYLAYAANIVDRSTKDEIRCYVDELLSKEGACGQMISILASFGLAEEAVKLIDSSKKPKTKKKKQTTPSESQKKPKTKKKKQTTPSESQTEEKSPVKTSDSERLEAMFPSFVCPISLEIMEDPVIAADGHTYSLDHITRHFERNGPISPMTGLALPNTTLIPNRTVRSAILEARNALQ